MILDNIKTQLSEREVTLVAVTKTRSIDAIMELYHACHKIFGENRVQELVTKYEEMPKDIEWHLIGHLQKNKVKYIAPFVKMIHSVESIELAKTIDKQAARFEREIDILIQIKIATEETKYGLQNEDLDSLMTELKPLKHIHIRGVMGMASFTSDTDQVRREFKHLKSVFDSLKQKHFTQDDDFSEISMGMSGDYKIAIEEGSTIVRIGSLLFT